jgi:alpha-glucosidase
MISEVLTTLYLPYPGREKRTVRVFVPAHEENERLPVVYMTDGQNLFDRERSGFGCWYTREAVREERRVSGRAAILVGIHNADPWRTNELMPGSIGEIQAPEEELPSIMPAGEVFDSFVLDTVKPAVEAAFPVKRGRENAAVYGSSMGGLMAFFAALRHPEVYAATGVLSPAFLFYREVDMERWILSMLREEKPFLYLYSGAGDELEKQIRQSTEQTSRILQGCYPEELLKLRIQPDQIHHEVAWEPVFRDFLHLFLSA